MNLASNNRDDVVVKSAVSRCRGVALSRCRKLISLPLPSRKTVRAPRETPTRVYWNARGKRGPIDAELRADKRLIRIKSNNRLHNALQDSSTLIMVLGKGPSHCRELVVDDLGYIGFCDASKLGAGGVWLSGTRTLSPTA
jgi:hypothetical protein